MVEMAPSARSVQTQKKIRISPALAILPPTSPAPRIWRIRTPSPKIPPRSMMMYPDRRSASTSVPQSQTTRISTPKRPETPHVSTRRATSSAQCDTNKRIESRDVMVNVTVCFMKASLLD